VPQPDVRLCDGRVPSGTVELAAAPPGGGSSQGTFALPAREGGANGVRLPPLPRPVPTRGWKMGRAAREELGDRVCRALVMENTGPRSRRVWWIVSEDTLAECRRAA